VALRDPTSVGVVNRVLAIPRKRTDKRLVDISHAKKSMLYWLHRIKRRGSGGAIMRYY
jgi:hypothetical protein